MNEYLNLGVREAVKSATDSFTPNEWHVFTRNTVAFLAVMKMKKSENRDFYTMIKHTRNKKNTFEV